MIRGSIEKPWRKAQGTRKILKESPSFALRLGPYHFIFDGTLKKFLGKKYSLKIYKNSSESK
jgi:hypothetical protein